MLKLKKMARKNFSDLMLQLLEFWKEQFPECTATSTYIVKFTGVVMGNEEREAQMIERWHKNMSMPILPSAAKYAKALERILGTQPTCYIACQYKDFDALFGSSDVSSLRELDVLSRCKAESFSQENKLILWKLIQSLNAAALNFVNEEMQRVPDRKELQDNIRKHKQMKELSSGASSMSKAFVANLESLVEILDGAKVEHSFRIREQNTENILQGWMQMLQNSEFEEKCSQEDEDFVRKFAWPQISDELKCMILLSLDTDATATFKNLNQMNTFCKVNSCVPTNMMGHIESCAFKLAEDLSSGKCDLSSLDLQGIGQHVLSQCDKEDLSKLTGNISELMPSINKITKF